MALSDYTPIIAWFADSLSDLDIPTGTTKSNPGSLTDPTLAGSPDSYADFDGTDSIGFTPAVETGSVGTGDFTLVMKARVDTFTTNAVLFANYDGSGSAGSAHGLYLYTQSSSTRLLAIRPPPRTTSNRTDIGVASNLVAGQDFIIAVKRASGTLTTFVDVDASGGMTSSTPSTNAFGTSSITESGIIALGANDTGGNPFDGRIYWVVFFDTAISDADLQLADWDDEANLKNAWFPSGTASLVPIVNVRRMANLISH